MVDLKKAYLNKKTIIGFLIITVINIFVINAMMPISKVSADTRFTLISFATQEELDQARQERDAALAQASAAAAIVSDLSSQRSVLNGELQELQAVQTEQEAQYELIASQYAASLVAKAEALDRYVTAQDELQATQQLFSDRVSVMFEYQNKSILEVLLESDSIAGFFTNIEIITLIADADDQAVDAMQVALENAQHQADVALAEAEEMEAQATEKQNELRELEEEIGITNNSIANLDSQIATAQATANSFNAQAAQLNDTIAQLQNELYAQVAPPSTATNAETGASENVPTNPPPPASNGSLSWPTWTTSINSYFGYRYHPITGEYKYHSGIDIGAGFGDTIMAAAAGTVTYVEEPCPGQNWGGSGYGNYCMIDHGNGVVTLYAHANDITVSQGTYVSAGQAIGVVGSTGSSSGAHLHFEVRVNGERVDPLGYLP